MGICTFQYTHNILYIHKNTFKYTYTYILTDIYTCMHSPKLQTRWQCSHRLSSHCTYLIKVTGLIKIINGILQAWLHSRHSSQLYMGMSTRRYLGVCQRGGVSRGMLARGMPVYLGMCRLEAYLEVCWRGGVSRVCRGGGVFGVSNS